jgi:hypothetical protein
VISATEAILSVSIIQGLTCPADPHDVPKSVVAALILMAMFFAGFLGFVVSQILLTRGPQQPGNRLTKKIIIS